MGLLKIKLIGKLLKSHKTQGLKKLIPFMFKNTIQVKEVIKKIIH